jgi:hypothetical protein
VTVSRASCSEDSGSVSRDDHVSKFSMLRDETFEVFTQPKVSGVAMSA